MGHGPAAGFFFLGGSDEEAARRPDESGRGRQRVPAPRRFMREMWDRTR